MIIIVLYNKLYTLCNNLKNAYSFFNLFQSNILRLYLDRFMDCLICVENLFMTYFE